MKVYTIKYSTQPMSLVVFKTYWSLLASRTINFFIVCKTKAIAEDSDGELWF